MNKLRFLYAQTCKWQWHTKEHGHDGLKTETQ